MPPSKQQALVLEAPLANFSLQTIDVPKPGAEKVLVKVQSVSLNPLDWKIQKYGGTFVKKYPAVIGSDVAGDVVEVGEGVTGVSVGDRVFLQCSFTMETGAFQQYVIAKHTLVGKIPNNFTYDEAATLPVCLVTAYLGFFQKPPSGFGLPNILTDGRNKYVGQAIVILGGSGSVGHFALQVARLSGFSTIITTASLKHTATLKSFGATHVIDRHLPADALSTAVSDITSEQPVKWVFDAVSLPETQQLGYDLLAPNGEILLVLPDVIKNKVEGKKVYNVIGVSSLPANRELVDVYYANITLLLERGEIKPTKVEVLPNGLASIPSGLKRLEDGQVSGEKLIARPQET